MGGTVTNIANWPFASALLYSSNLVGYFQECGGTILTTTAILTAAHCVQSVSLSILVLLFYLLSLNLISYYITTLCSVYFPYIILTINLLTSSLYVQ